MNRMLGAVLLLALTMTAHTAGQGAAPQADVTLGAVVLTTSVMADGQRLPAGTYQLRLGTSEPQGVVGQSPDGTRYVEFLRSGRVVGRELATVIPNADIQSVAKSRGPAAGGVRVDVLKGDEYVRVWINRGGNHYIIHLPPAS
jgi:hypothetical protein